MERLTFEGNFCDIAQCKEIPCPYNGECSQRKVWERLKAYEDTHMMPSDVTSMRMDRMLSIIQMDISKLPAADVSPVVRGKWVHITRYNEGERMIATCSRCRNRGEVRSIRTEFGIWEIDSPRCPNCGAKMDGGDNHETD